MNFEQLFGGVPQWVVKAPGRVNLIGEHTDYHEGFVFPMAIDRHVEIQLRASNQTELASDGFERSGRFVRGGVASLPHVPWIRYALGSAALLHDSGLQIPQVQALVRTSIPYGAGLSSSAAIECAFASAFNAIGQLGLTKAELARLCQRAENEVVGVPCGIMDQTAVMFGEAGAALFIDTRTPGSPEPVALPAGLDVVVCNSGEKHNLGDSGYPVRRRESESAARKMGVRVLRDATIDQLAMPSLTPTELKRARHVITENERVTAFRSALKAGDVASLGTLMRASHESMRDDYEITTPLIDTLAAYCRSQSGCVGARMTGGGFGGCVVALVEQEATASFVAAVQTHLGSTDVFPVAPSRGVVVEALA